MNTTESNIRTYVVCPDLEGLFFSHQQSDTLSFLVLQQFNLASPSFLPLPGFIVKPVQLALSATPLQLKIG